MQDARELTSRFEPRTDLERAAQVRHLVFGRVVASVAEALVPVVIVRLLSPHDVGVLAGALVVYNTAALVLITGVPSALSYFLPTRSAAVRRAIVVQTAWLLVGLGLVGAALLLGASYLAQLAGGAAAWLGGEPGDSPALVASAGALAWLAAYPLGDLPARIIPGLLVIEGRSRAAAIMGIVRAAGTVLSVLVPLAAGLGLRGALAGMSVFGLLHGLTLVYFVRTAYPEAARARADVGRLELVRFGFYAGLSDIVSSLNTNLDRYMIQASFAASILAQYQAGAWQIPVIVVIPFGVGAVFTPHFTRLFQSGRAEEAILVWRRTIDKTALLVVPITMVFLVGAEEAMALLFTPSYAPAAAIFRWYCVLTLGRVATFGNLLVAAGRPRYVLWSALVALGSNVALSLPAMWLLGFQGPALGTALAFVPTATFYCWSIARASGLRLSSVFPLVRYSKVLMLTAVAFLPALAFKLWVPVEAPLRLAGIALIGLGLYAGLATAAGMVSRGDWAFLLGRRTLASSS